MVTKVSPELISDPERDRGFLESEIGKKKEPVAEKLAQHIHSVWLRNQEDAKPTRKRMLECLRRVKGEYEPNKLKDIKAFGGSQIYVRNAETKARSSTSWIEDIYRGDTDLPWELEPTDEPDLPKETFEKIQNDVMNQANMFREQVIQAGLQMSREEFKDLVTQYYEEKLEEERAEMKKTAKERCERASSHIRDQNQEGGWDQAFKEFLFYFSRMPFSAIKGPVLTNKPRQSWEVDELTGEISYVTKNELVNDVYAPSPFNLYPEFSSGDIQNGDLIELHELSKQSIYDLIGVPGYDEDEIRKALSRYDSGDIKAKWLNIEDEVEVRRMEKEVNAPSANKQSIDSSSDLIYAMEFSGSTSGRILMEWDKKERLGELDPDKQYQINAWMIDKHVIKAVINPDSLGRKPCHISSWAKNPNTFVGEGLIEFSGPIEDAMNAVMRALINNVGIASGPMAEIDKDRIDTRMPIFPWRQIESTSRAMKNDGPAVNYYQPQMHAQELISVYTFLSQVLDEMTVPAYTQGQSQTGVTSGTATVFTQLLAAASRSIKAVVANIDNDIIKPFIQMSYDFNMKFSDDESIKGDARVVAKGVTGLLAKEQQAQRKVEYLQVVSNPVLSQILGPKNLGSIVAQIAKSNDISLPDMNRLEGDVTAEQTIEQMLMAQSGVDPLQQGGQVAAGGGAPTQPKATNPDGGKAGVNNAQ